MALVISTSTLDKFVREIMALGRLVGKDVTHCEPDILGLCGLVQELLTLALLWIKPVTLAAVVHPRSLNVDG